MTVRRKEGGNIRKKLILFDKRKQISMIPSDSILNSADAMSKIVRNLYLSSLANGRGSKKSDNIGKIQEKSK